MAVAPFQIRDSRPSSSAPAASPAAAVGFPLPPGDAPRIVSSPPIVATNANTNTTTNSHRPRLHDGSVGVSPGRPPNKRIQPCVNHLATGPPQVHKQVARTLRQTIETTQCVGLNITHGHIEVGCLPTHAYQRKRTPEDRRKRYRRSPSATPKLRAPGHVHGIGVEDDHVSGASVCSINPGPGHRRVPAGPVRARRMSPHASATSSDRGKPAAHDPSSVLSPILLVSYMPEKAVLAVSPSDRQIDRCVANAM